MLRSFEEFIEDETVELVEKLITFGGRAYPRFGNVVILAGGAGSGKGFIKDNLVGLEGKVFDVDQLKQLAIRTPAIIKKVKDQLDIDLKNINLSNEEHVRIVHEIIGDLMKFPNKRQQAFFANVLMADPERKPNIIFDVTLKDLRKLEKITRMASQVGYDKDKVHIVWVVNDIEVAKKQNLDPERGRVVPVEILVNTHRGASETMKDILNMGNRLKKYMNGDIVFAFNKIGVDSDLRKSGRGGRYIENSNYFYVKRAGKAVTSVNDLSMDIRKKIANYVPKNISWD